MDASFQTLSRIVGSYYSLAQSGLFSFKVFVQFIGSVGNRNSLLPRICGARKSKISEN